MGKSYFGSALLFIIVALNVQANTPMVFIVNAENKELSITQEMIRSYYLKKDRHWPDGTEVKFLDRSQGSEIRSRFLSKFVKMSVIESELYWIRQQTRTGNSAPLQEASESMAIKFVSIFKGAITYIGSKEVKDKNVKIIRIQE